MTAEAPIPRELQPLTWRDISRLQTNAQRKIAHGEPLTPDELRVWRHIWPDYQQPRNA